MPSCAIKWCKNTTKNKKKKKCVGVTFHAVPIKEIYRENWVPAIRLGRNDPKWEPTPSTVVCSNHFDDKDIYVTKRGFRRITRTGYPKKNLLPPSKMNPNVDTWVSPDELSKFVYNPPPCGCNTSVLDKSSVTVLDLTSSPNSNSKSDIMMSPSISSPSSPNFLDVPEYPEICVEQTSNFIIHKKQKLRKTPRKLTCPKNRNLTLKEILSSLKSQNFIDSDLYNSLSDNLATVDLLNNLNWKKHIKYKTPAAAMKKFCLTLNYYSPKAYEHVRRKFNTCFPRLITLSRWYACLNGEPGFTEESFQTLKAKSQHNEHRPICSLIFGEVAIRTQKIWDGKKYIGLVDMGIGVDESASLASQVLVFLLVGINHTFKMPLGYFLIDGISGEQKANLIKLCLFKCIEANVDVVSVTFDGHATNYTAIELLGCKLADSANLKTTFKHPADDSEVVCFVDPSHVVKLIRNQFESKKEFVDENNKTVAWQDVIQLSKMRNDVGINSLGNKLTKRLVYIQNQITQLELATHLLSRSVATALKTYRKDIKLSNFSHAEPTENFIQKINDMFDVFNSKSMGRFGLQKPLHLANKDFIFSFLENLKTYIINLKVKSVIKHTLVRHGRPANVLTRCHKPVLAAKCRRGFLSILINIESLKKMYHRLIETEKKLIYIPVYKFSQSHLELLFTSIRMHGGFNDNPNVRQFKSVYKKLLRHHELRCLGTDNGVSLEDIAILNCTSATTTFINTTTTSYRHQEQEDFKEQEKASLQFLRKIQEDTIELASALNVAEFSDLKEIIIGYIAGRTVQYISKLLKCEKCLENLLSKDKHDFHRLITARNKNGFCFPSQDVYNICATSEVILRKLSMENVNLVWERQHTYILTQILELFIGNNRTFNDLENDHDYAGLSHKVNLIRLVIEKYLSIRLYHISENALTMSSKRLKIAAA